MCPTPIRSISSTAAFTKSAFTTDYGKAEPEHELRMGPNIKDWPEQPALSDDLLVKVVSYITDPVTTTDELIPSGETSSYRSNPLRLAEFALSRKDPGICRPRKGRARCRSRARTGRSASAMRFTPSTRRCTKAGIANKPAETVIGSTIYANKPGDGSAREQAASCQRVLGALRQHREGIRNQALPQQLHQLGHGAAAHRHAGGLRVGRLGICARHPRSDPQRQTRRLSRMWSRPNGSVKKTSVSTGALTEDERQIIADGCLINYYRNH